MPICKMCFQSIKVKPLFDWFTPPMLCPKCYHKLEWRHEVSKFEGTPTESFFDYGEVFQERIHQFKTLGDVEIGPTFLNQHLLYLRWKYHRYTLVFAPSHVDDVARRGFQHLESIFGPLKLPMIQPFFKNQPYRQATQERSQRSQIQMIMELKPNTEFKDRLCLVDDVMTSGETMRAMKSKIPVRFFPTMRMMVLARVNPVKKSIQSDLKMIK